MWTHGVHGRRKKVVEIFVVFVAAVLLGAAVVAGVGYGRR